MSQINPKFPLFISSRGAVAIRRRAASAIVKRWTEKHLNKPITPSVLRNSYGFYVYTKTKDVLCTKLIMGYKNVTTVFRYEQVNMEAARKEYQKHPRFRDTRGTKGISSDISPAKKSSMH